MPEISLLNPTVLNGVIEKFTAPEDMLARSTIFNTPEPSQDPTAAWDVVEGNREIAKPNVPNSEAEIVPQLGMARRTASFVYLREKKVFSPTTIRWLRTPGQLAAKNAEAKVLRELQDLDRRFEAFAEWCCWQALKGTLTFDTPKVKATVDYGLDSSHKPIVPGTAGWDDNITPADWLDQVSAWKRLGALDARTPMTDAYINGATWGRIQKILASKPDFLSDRQKDAMLSNGEVSGLAGLTWHTYDAQWVDDDGNVNSYIGDDEVIIISKANRAFYTMEGPSADHDAPQGHIGKFAKSWQDPDPSARQHLQEWMFLPIIERPEQVVYVSDVTP